jgi:hypothetical protein
MASRTRRYASRPKLFALILVGVAALSAAAVAGLAERGKSTLYSNETGRS